MESICVEDSVKIQHRMEELHHVTHALKNSILLMAFKQQYLTVHFSQFFFKMFGGILYITRKLKSLILFVLQEVGWSPEACGRTKKFILPLRPYLLYFNWNGCDQTISSSLIPSRWQKMFQVGGIIPWSQMAHQPVSTMAEITTTE